MAFVWLTHETHDLLTLKKTKTITMTSVSPRQSVTAMGTRPSVGLTKRCTLRPIRPVAVFALTAQTTHLVESARSASPFITRIPKRISRCLVPAYVSLWCDSIAIIIIIIIIIVIFIVDANLPSLSGRCHL